MKKVHDYAIKKGMKAAELVEQMASAGFQGTEIGEAVRLIKRMKKEKATIFLSFTANMLASGLRGIITQLVRQRFIDVIITTGGSIDHDIIRTKKSYHLGDFNMDDTKLHKKGVNRLGNILIPNDRYLFLEKFMQPLFADLDSMKHSWAPSEIIHEIGKKLSSEDSFLYWAAKNEIPVFSPGITDSAIGLQMYFFKQDNKDFAIDVSADMRLADIVINSEKRGGIILGGGIAKHHTIGVNILRDGLDYAVYLTTSSPWDGSLSGATPNEAKSWSKIMEQGSTVTVYGDASVTLPLITVGVLE